MLSMDSDSSDFQMDGVWDFMNDIPMRLCCELAGSVGILGH